MSAALLEALLGEHFGPDTVAVKSSGFGPAGLPPIPDAVDAMSRRGLDISEHRSSSTTVTLVDGADLILTAERDHVVKIAGLSPAAFRRTFTLPEFLDRAADASANGDQDGGDGGEFFGGRERRGIPHGARGDVPARIVGWVEHLTESRRAAEYLRESVPEVADPTGWSQRAFETAVQTIEQQCREVAAHLARVARG
jgi:protein-tyrosine-phosphatase